jgi:hypothetical protein
MAVGSPTLTDFHNAMILADKRLMLKSELSLWACGGVPGRTITHQQGKMRQNRNLGRPGFRSLLRLPSRPVIAAAKECGGSISASGASPFGSSPGVIDLGDIGSLLLRQDNGAPIHAPTMYLNVEADLLGPSRSLKLFHA